MNKVDAAVDVAMMQRARALAEVYVGQTSPNPAVGAVVVREGRIIGEGAHQRAGQPHAEANALAACTEDPKGATLYVTLEPCSTAGRVPPCCDLIIRKQIKRVVIGCLDPNPRHAGRAIPLLTQAGIQVDLISEVETKACRALIQPFAKAITVARPYVRLKLAMTLDGAIADREQRSRWISGSSFYTYVQQLRQRVDAIMVGAGTVCADHPSLQPHLAHATPKVRIIVNRHTLPSPEDCPDGTLVATRDLNYDGQNLPALLQAICQRGINDILCEGGGQLAGALLEAGLVDELYCLYAPKILGDPMAVKGIVGGKRLLPNAITPQLVEVKTFESDVLLHYTF